MHLKIFSVLLILAVASSACSNSSNLGEKRRGGSAQNSQADSIGNGGSSGKSGKPSNRESAPDKVPDTGSVLFFGESYVGGSGLFSLPLGASDAIASRFRNSYDTFSEVIATDEQDVVLLVSNDAFSVSQYKLQKANLQSGQMKELYISKFPIGDLVLSPDRTLVAFSEGNVIRVLNWRTQRAKPRTLESVKDAEDSEPAFFDDSTIVFRRTEKSGAHYRYIFITAGLGSQAFDWLNAFNDKEIRKFQMAPSGSAFAFLAISETESALYLAKKGDGEPGKDSAPELIRVTEEGEEVFEPSFSADGEKLLFWVRSGLSEKVVVHGVGKNVRETAIEFLAPENRKGLSKLVCPSISASTRSVLFAGQSGTWSAIFRYDTQTGQTTRMTDSSIPPSYSCPKALQAGGKK